MDDAAIRAGLEQARLAARFQVLLQVRLTPHWNYPNHPPNRRT